MTPRRVPEQQFWRGVVLNQSDPHTDSFVGTGGQRVVQIGRVTAIVGYAFALGALRMVGMGTRPNRPWYWGGVALGVTIGSLGAALWLIGSGA